MSKSVLYEQDDRIVKITLNRPDTRNALSGDIIEGLVEYIQKADKDKNVGCVILTGAGKAFSAGGNVKNMQNKSGNFSGSSVGLRDRYKKGIHTVSYTHLTLPTNREV